MILLHDGTAAAAQLRRLMRGETVHVGKHACLAVVGRDHVLNLNVLLVRF